MQATDEVMDSLLFKANRAKLSEVRMPRCRATFEWWILRDKYGVELPGSPRGPFVIEAFFDDSSGMQKGRWIAQVIPTQQRLAERFKTYKECFDYARSQFREQTTPWTVEE